MESISKFIKKNMANCPNCGSSHIALRQAREINLGAIATEDTIFVFSTTDPEANVCLDCGTAWQAKDLYAILQVIQQSIGTAIDLSNDNDRLFAKLFTKIFDPENTRRAEVAGRNLFEILQIVRRSTQKDIDLREEKDRAFMTRLLSEYRSEFTGILNLKENSQTGLVTLFVLIGLFGGLIMSWNQNQNGNKILNFFTDTTTGFISLLTVILSCAISTVIFAFIGFLIQEATPIGQNFKRSMLQELEKKKAEVAGKIREFHKRNPL